MTINQIQLANTFDVWRIGTNQLITIANDLKEGNLLSTGTVSISNPSGFQNNVSLNVTSGMIYGDGGLLSNVGKPASITNIKLANSNVKVTATQGQVFLSSGTIELGSTVYLNVANLVTVNTDTSVANIASANLVNAVHKIAIDGSIVASASYNKSNSANVMAENASNLANSLNVIVLSYSSAVTGLGTATGALSTNAAAAFNKANAANVLAFNTGIGANAFAAATIAGANTRVGTGANAFSAATIAGANTAVGAGANNFLLSVIDGANTAVGDGANTFFIETLDGANTIAAEIGGSAFDRANTYVMMHYVMGNPGNTAHVYFHAPPFDVDIPAGLTGSRVVANNRPTAVMAMTITKNGTNVGTINFTGGVTGSPETATFTVGSTISLTSGDVLGIRNGPTVSPNFQNIMFSIVGTKI
jgi:hypothetical protein